MKVLLWAVQRLIGGLSHIGSERDIASRLHVVLPGSPNRGMFGGDGAYGEAKSALDALVTRWKAETSWSQRVSLAHALIGWTKGTGLMGHNDAIVGAVEEAGVTTYTTEQMAAMLLDLCDIESKVAAARAPIKADLTGGLGEIDIDMAELAAKAREDMAAESAAAASDEDDETAPSRRCRRRRAATPQPRRRRGTTSTSIPPTWWSSSAARSSDRTVRRGPASRSRCPASCRPPACSNWPGPPGWSSGRTIPSRVGTTPRRAIWSTRASWSSATTTPSSSGSASGSSSTTVRSTPITPRRCWFRCSWTRTSRSWCRRRPTPAHSRSPIPSTP